MPNRESNEPEIVPIDERKVEKIIEFPGKNKELLYDEILIWIMKVFNDAESFINYKDKETGIIIGKGETNFKWTSFVGSALPHICYYTMQIDIKDEKIRIQFYDLMGTMPDGAGGVKILPLKNREHINSVLLKFNLWIEDLTNHLSQENNEW